MQHTRRLTWVQHTKYHSCDSCNRAAHEDGSRAAHEIELACSTRKITLVSHASLVRVTQQKYKNTGVLPHASANLHMSCTVAGLLTGKTIAAYAALAPVVCEKVKEAILRRYKISEETYRQRFRQDRKKGEESYREYADRLGDHFIRWTASQSIPLEELIMLEQFLAGVPEDL